MPEQFWFGKSSKLLGVLHRCSGIHGHQFGILFFPGFGQTKAGPTFLFTTLSQQLSSIASSFQFDYRGWGDSEGELADCTLESILADAWDALEDFRHRVYLDSLVIIGSGIGNWVAAKVASQQKDVALALITPHHLPRLLTDIIDEPIYTQYSKENALVDTHELGPWTLDSPITILFKQLGAGKSRSKGVLLQWQFLVDLASLNVFDCLKDFSGPVLEFYRPVETPFPLTSHRQALVLPVDDLSRKDPDPRNSRFLVEEISSWIFRLHEERR